MNNEDNSKETMQDTSKKQVNKSSKKVTIRKFKDLEGKFLHVKVGDKASPATDVQIGEIQDKLVALLEENNINCLAFVTHHAVTMEIIEKDNND